MEMEEFLLLEERSYQCNNPVGPHFTISNAGRLLTLTEKYINNFLVLSAHNCYQIR